MNQRQLVGGPSLEETNIHHHQHNWRGGESYLFRVSFLGSVSLCFTLHVALEEFLLHGGLIGFKLDGLCADVCADAHEKDVFPRMPSHGKLASGVGEELHSETEDGTDKRSDTHT
eukprot:TRINITY_DN17292_c0_g1_i1.p1 TRINITY_DN17292_c0_g1~~TRINITY_DN17292_c0_g1_i1.p1  ORF type:complete len:115 (+),score=8.19 TRINITY_DN17292_c0_g1_i1:179-523(+)